jgi:hypothetical protein
MFKSEKSKEEMDQAGMVFMDQETKKDEDGVISIKRYSFKDINKLDLKSTSGPKNKSGQQADATADKSMPYKFVMNKSKPGMLTIMVDQSKFKESGKAPQDEKPLDENSLNMMRSMFKGMRIQYTLELNSQIIKTNAAYTSGNRVTLFDMDFEKLMNEMKPGQSFSQGMFKDANNNLAALKKLPGVKVETQAQVQVEFK